MALCYSTNYYLVVVKPPCAFWNGRPRPLSDEPEPARMEQVTGNLCGGNIGDSRVRHAAELGRDGVSSTLAACNNAPIAQ
jgi:hypothetical protein